MATAVKERRKEPAMNTTIAYRAAGSGNTLNALGEAVTVAVAAADTGGAYTVVTVTSPPQGGPPALHTHPAAETFVILAGEYEFSAMGADGAYTFRAAAGDTVHVPGGAPHNYRNIGASEGRYAATFTPGGMEAFFADLAALAAEAAGPPDRERAMAICRRHQVEFMGPPAHH